MNGQDFTRISHDAFEPFLNELGFVMGAPSISGRFYRVNFKGQQRTVSISYEPGDEALFIMVYNEQRSALSDIDDRTITPRLSDLNNRFMHMISADERMANELAFEKVLALDNEERLLLKCAKELRLVLPKYLESLNM